MGFLRHSINLLLMIFIQSSNCQQPSSCGTIRRSNGLELLPWMVSLRGINNAATGVLVDRQWVLAPASRLATPGGLPGQYKIDVSDIVANLGMSEVLSNNVQYLSVTEAIIHPRFSYRFNVAFNDFALYKLEPMVRITTHVEPICLPDHLCSNASSRSTLRDDLCDRGRLSATYWRTDDDIEGLAKASFSIINNDDCNFSFHSSQVCAAPNENINSYCDGGALACEISNKVYALGIESFQDGEDCGLANSPLVYSRICSVISWIRQTISGAQRPVTTASQPTRTPRFGAVTTVTTTRNTGTVGVGTCGIARRPRATEGRASLGEHPWVARIQAYMVNCAGSLIAPSWVLTSADCVSSLFSSGIDGRVIANVSLGLTNTSSGEQRFVVTSERIFVNPQFNKSNYPSNHDIALLKLETPARIGDNVRTICLPSESSCDSTTSRFGSSVDGCSDVQFATWGTRASSYGSLLSDLRQLNLNIYPRSNCRLDDSLKICAGKNISLNGCQLNGEPLICKDSRTGENRLIGSATDAFGGYCGGRETHIPFTRVCSYLTWIREIMRTR